MATNHAENFKLIEVNYLQAAENYYDDMSATRTPQEAQIIEQNYQEAEAAWSRALVSVLNRTEASVDNAKKELKLANKKVAEARATHEAIASLAKKLQIASSLAGTLARIAAI